MYRDRGFSTLHLWLSSLAAALAGASFAFAIAHRDSQNQMQAMSALHTATRATYGTEVHRLREEIERIETAHALRDSERRHELARLKAAYESAHARIATLHTLAGTPSVISGAATSLSLQAPKLRRSVGRPAPSAWASSREDSLVSDLSEALVHLESDMRLLLTQMEQQVTARIEDYDGILTDLGLDLRALRGSSGEPYGVGGPQLPSSSGSESFDEAIRALEDKVSEMTQRRETIAHLPLAQPVADRPRVTSRYGPRRDPFTGKPAHHSGIDFGVSTGTEVRATGVGTVTFAGTRYGYGLLVEIAHAFGYRTRYAHLNRILVMKGERIGQGDVIALSGTTGRSTGPHLHYEVMKDQVSMDPARFLDASQALERLSL